MNTYCAKIPLDTERIPIAIGTVNIAGLYDFKKSTIYTSSASLKLCMYCAFLTCALRSTEGLVNCLRSCN